MALILVTGGTGGLGREIVTRLVAAKHGVRVLSRRPGTGGVEAVRGDLGTGEGIAGAVRGADAVVHCASDFGNARATDVEGTSRLVEHARAAGVRHLLYPGIVGADRVPTEYYGAKTDAEDRIEKGGVPWSILRATQFHAFIDTFLRRFTPLPLCFLPPRLLFQPVDTGEVADALVAAIADGPGGRLPDLAGPRVFTVAELLATWSRARGVTRWLVPLPHLGAAASAIRDGALTGPSARRGTVTWESWLEEKYAAPRALLAGEG